MEITSRHYSKHSTIHLDVIKESRGFCFKNASFGFRMYDIYDPYLNLVYHSFDYGVIQYSIIQYDSFLRTFTHNKRIR